MTSKCLVCGGPSTEPHFGADVCRACAAFFRRFVLSKKTIVVCIENGQCNIDFRERNLCRLCRMKKCLKVGMKKSKVQAPRDCIKLRKVRNSFSECNDGHADNEVIEIPLLISLPFEYFRLKKAFDCYQKLEESRRFVYGNPSPKEVGLVQTSDFYVRDKQLIFDYIENTFSEFGEMNYHDKQRQFYSCFSKFTLLESAYLSSVNHGPFRYYIPNGDFAEDVESYYEPVDESPLKKTNSILVIFKPYWDFYFKNVVAPYIDLKLDAIELIALFCIVLWDPGYENQSEESTNSFNRIRTEILRELCLYHTYYGRQDEDSALRLSQLLCTLPMLERGSDTLKQEMEMISMYRIRHNDEFYRLIHGLHRV